MIKIGPHLTIAKGYANAASTAVRIGANTFQFFSRNPRGSSMKSFDNADIQKFREIRHENGLGPLMAHAPYTMNLASGKKKVTEFSKNVLNEDIKRMDSIGIEFFNFHPGSHIGIGINMGIEKISNALNEGIRKTETIMLLLETMSGKGTEIGYQFEHLKKIIDTVACRKRVGVCMDLCHVFSAGYDIVNHFEQVLYEFDQIIGIEKLKAVHLNDSMMPFGAMKDRHAPVGEGQIGWMAIANILNTPVIRKLPLYLETPLDDEGHRREILNIKQIIKCKDK